MAVPVELLRTKYGLSPEALKSAFDSKKLLKDKETPTAKLVDCISQTIRSGVDRNRNDYRLYKAMDWAYDSPFYQISYTQLKHLLSKGPDDKKVMETVNSWGLAHLLPDVMENGKVCCDKVSGKPIKALNLPVFFNIFVPIVMAYITIRWAKLFNDRDLVPLYKYEPIQYTKENRLRCEIITQIIQRQSAQFDYKADLRQSILQMLLYGFCINFPREAWFVEKQCDESDEEKIVREGLRFNMPHPSRMYYDLYHRLSSLNSNSGCNYVGYWELCRYREIFDNKLYWNKDKITMGALDWFDLGRSDFLDQVFPCTMKFPSRSGDGTGGTGALDREAEAANTYGNGDLEMATLLTQHFQRITPKEHGLGTYEYPVWFRFVFASDTTVIWAEPLAYDKFPTYCYDADFNRSRFRSLALEIIPFQDHVSNLLTQWIIAVKQNLMNPIFFDKTKIPVEHMKILENMGFKEMGGRVYIPFSATENWKVGVDQREAFFTPTLTHHNTAELANLVSGVLNMLDRIMLLSPQEIGQAAPHEQTAEETRVIAGNTSTRVTFTGGFVDDADYAKKCVLYDATMAYADNDITVGITSAFAATKAEFDTILKNIGFSISDDSTYDPQQPELMHTVKGKKSALTIESFASTRDNVSRINNPALADSMSKIFGAIAQNPVLIESIGPGQLVELLNQVITVAGLPQEFRLRGKKVDTNAPAAEQAKQTAELLKNFAGQVQQLVKQSQQETLQAAAQQTTQIVGQAMQAAQQQTQAGMAAIAQQAQAAAQQAGPVVQQAVQQAQAASQELVATVQEQEQQIAALNQAVQQLQAALAATQNPSLVTA